MIIAMKFLIAIIVFCAMTVQGAPRVCKHAGKTYNVGSSWVFGNSICRCNPNGHPWCTGAGKCDAWGDPHFTSFDGKKFDFQGVCRYILTRDCCSNKFTIEVEQRQYSPSTSVIDKFTIRFANRVVTLEKVQVLEVDGLAPAGLFYDDPQLRCEVISGYITVALKQIGVWFRWNWIYHVQVYTTFSYRTRLCGLCGDFNGNPNNDLILTPTGEVPATIAEWGKSWRTQHNQPERCIANEPPPPNDPGDVCLKNAAFAKEVAKCKAIMQSNVFKNCHKRLKPDNFIQDCETEACECLRNNQTNCICTSVSGYEKACEAINIKIDDKWKVNHGCGVCVYKGTVYQHTGTWRDNCKLYRCDNGKNVHLRNISSCCHDKDTNSWYLNGQSWLYKCQIRTCVKGNIKSRLDKNCCQFGGKTYPSGHGYNQGKCQKRVCCKGVWTVYKTCCLYKGSIKTMWQSWKDNCLICVCKGGGHNQCMYARPTCPCGERPDARCNCKPFLPAL